MKANRAWWALAGAALIVAGVLNTSAALLHWSPCTGVDFDVPACVEAQRDYAYYLPHAVDGQDWQPLTLAAGLAALAFLATAAGWIAVVAGLRLPGRSGLVLGLPALLPALSGIEGLVGLAGANVLFGPLLSVFSLAVLVGSAVIVWWAVQERTVAPGLVTILGLLVVNASGLPAQILAFLGWSSFYGSFDNPPFLGLERGLLGIGAGLVIGLAAGLTRPGGSPAHGAGATLERAAHR